MSSTTPHESIAVKLARSVLDSLPLEVLAYLSEEGVSTLSDLHRRMPRVPASSVLRVLERMEDVGLVRHEGPTQGSPAPHWQATSLGDKLVRSLGSTGEDTGNGG